MAKSASVRLATRQSKLALWQSEHVAKRLADVGMDAKLVPRKTEGDLVQDRFLHEIGGKGLFIRDLEQAILDGTADAAVHSLKDLPVRLPDGFALHSILPRHSSLDAIIWHPKKARFLPQGRQLGREEFASIGPLTIATGSLRRRALLKQCHTGISIVPIRGNVDTRLQKLKTSLWDAIILAEASLERLQITDFPYATLDPQWFVPCAGQGALAIEAPTKSPFAPTLAKLNCAKTALVTTIERHMLAALGGDCTMPCGVHVTINDHQQATLNVIVLSRHGDQVRVTLSGHAHSNEDIQGLVEKAMDGLYQQGLRLILADLKLPWHDRED